MKTELSIEQAQAVLLSYALASHPKALPYRGYACIVADDGKRQIRLSHDPLGHYWLENVPSGAVEIAKGVIEYPDGRLRCDI